MIHLRTLGTLDLTRSDGTEADSVLAQPKRLAVLIYLELARPRGFQRRDRLVAMFWPDSDAERARAALNRAVYFLRRTLGEAVIVNRGVEEIAINTQVITSDAASFADLLDENPREALELYRGELLPGFFISEATGFEEWLESERARLRDGASQAAGALVEEAEEAGNLAAAAHWARRGVELAPFSEPELRRLLRLLDATGDRAGAVDAYERFSTRLSSGLELEPAPETRALIDEIRARSIALTDASRQGENGTRPHATQPASVNGVATPVRSRRRWMAAAAALLAAVATPALVMARADRRHVDARRVFVTPLLNLTGDAAFDGLGRVAADRINESLSGTGLVDVVAPDADSGPRATAGNRQAEAIRTSDEHRAGIVISGELHRTNGHLTVQAWITDIARGSVVWAVPSFSAPVDSVQRAVDEVRDRVAGAVAALNAPRFASWFPIATVPPRFSAFQEFAHGVELQLRGSDKDAIPHLRRAIELDSMFLWAHLQLAYTHRKLYEEPVMDSIAGLINGKREQLMPLQRHWLDWMLSMKAEDPLSGYRAMKAAAELAPDAFLVPLALAAFRLNRPREMIAVLERAGSDGWFRNDVEYWDLLTFSYHAIKDRTRELAKAREARRRFPDRIDVLAFELSALAAEGRVTEVRALLDTALAFPRAKLGVTGVIADMPGLGLWPARLMISAATELRAHGFSAEAKETFQRAVDWYEAQRPAGLPESSYRFELARAYYQAENLEAAQAMFRALYEANPNAFVYSGFLGTIAARLGDSTTARRIHARFDSLRPTLSRPHAIAGYWQSKISGVLGDTAGAVRSLNEAFGPQGRSGIHGEFDYERIATSRMFREFIRPKG